jgi:DNA-3-methyladenine glycosylase
MTLAALPRDFFAAEPLDVARRLLSQRVVRRIDGALLAGRIVEVEAYGGREDTTSHASRGANGRAAGMFGQVGRAYVYLIYGIHSCLNVVAHADDQAGAVLIRALAPEEGVEQMRALRGGAAGHLVASGPGRLCKALAIDRALDGLDLCCPAGPLSIAPGPQVPDAAVSSSVRVGVVGRPDDTLLPWRLYITDDPNVSPGRRN